jgi:hypothetical protein
LMFSCPDVQQHDVAADAGLTFPPSSRNGLVEYVLQTLQARERVLKEPHTGSKA